MVKPIKDKELDDIYGYIDTLMHRGQWEVIDAILKTVSETIHKFDVDEVLGYLTISLAGKEHLLNRGMLYNTAKKQFSEEDKNNDYSLFFGLE